MLPQVQQLPKPDNTCLIGVRSWYGEVKNYIFETSNPYSLNWPRNVGHFTQTASARFLQGVPHMQLVLWPAAAALHS